MELLLRRGQDDGTRILGTLRVGTLMLSTLEPAWKNNIYAGSAIPAGRYKCAWYDSPTHGRVLQLQGVPSRQFIEIHTGNLRSETHGCILVGERVGMLDGEPAVIRSVAAMAALRRIADTEAEVWLTVTSVHDDKQGIE